MIKVVYAISSPVYWAAFDWVARDLDRDRFDQRYLLLNEGTPPMEAALRGRGVPVAHIPLGGRRPLARAAREVARHCRAIAPDIVHAHFFNACLPGLLGAYLAGVPHRVHTRHHAGPYPPSFRPRSGVLKDRATNLLSTAIVAPSELARRVLIDYDRVPARKVSVVPHGFDLAAFASATEADADRMRAKYGIGDGGPVVGVVARFLAIKGVEYTIRAFGRLLDTFPRAFLVLANARGAQEADIRRCLRELPEGRYATIVYEDDMPALYRAFDLFVHVPVEPHYESFGQVYVEAMAAGIPMVCTLAGAGPEFIRDGENALVVEARRADRILDALLQLLADPRVAARLAAEARRTVTDRFGLDRMLDGLADLYTDLVRGNRGNRSWRHSP